MVTRCSGSLCGVFNRQMACPASCTAVMRRPRSLIARLRRSRPQLTLSRASSNSASVISFSPLRAASRAASLTRLASWAPEKPDVPRAIRSKLTPGAIFTFLACTCRICSRPRTSGRFTTTCRSKRPGRSRAGSRMSARLVAAMTITLELFSKPSISTSRAFSVCSRSSLPPPMP